MLSNGLGAISSRADNAQGAAWPCGAPCLARSSTATALRGISPQEFSLLAHRTGNSKEGSLKQLIELLVTAHKVIQSKNALK